MSMDSRIIYHVICEGPARAFCHIRYSDGEGIINRGAQDLSGEQFAAYKQAVTLFQQQGSAALEDVNRLLKQHFDIVRHRDY